MLAAAGSAAAPSKAGTILRRTGWRPRPGDIATSYGPASPLKTRAPGGSSMMPLSPPERPFMIASPYLLYLGHVNDEVGIKTSRGLAVFRPEDCVGEFRHDDCELSLGLPRMRSEEHTSELPSLMRTSYA